MNFLSGEAVVGEGGVRDGDLQRRDVEGRHVVLAAALVLVVDDVLPDVVLGAGVLDLGLAPPVVHHEHQHQHCNTPAVTRRARQPTQLDN